MEKEKVGQDTPEEATLALALVGLKHGFLMAEEVANANGIAWNEETVRLAARKVSGEVPIFAEEGTPAADNVVVFPGRGRFKAVEVTALAAASEDDGSPLEFSPPEGCEESSHWSLRRMMILNREGEQYLEFQAHAEVATLYFGRRIVVSVREAEYDLGVVDEDGLACLRVKGPIDFSQPIRVLIESHD